MQILDFDKSDVIEQSIVETILEMKKDNCELQIKS